MYFVIHGRKTHKIGSNAISSALFHRLSNTDYTDKSIVRLVADGCVGQNKNSAVLGACSILLLKRVPRTIEIIELVFPVTRYSYIPSDRVFGNIERELWKRDTILNPETYREIISDYGTILKLGENCEIVNFKGATEEIFKNTFKITECKPIFIRRNRKRDNVDIRREPVYKHQVGLFKVLTKKNIMLWNSPPKWNLLYFDLGFQ